MNCIRKERRDYNNFTCKTSCIQRARKFMYQTELSRVYSLNCGILCTLLWVHIRDMVRQKILSFSAGSSKNWTLFPVRVLCAVLQVKCWVSDPESGSQIRFFFFLAQVPGKKNSRPSLRQASISPKCPGRGRAVLPRLRNIRCGG